MSQQARQADLPAGIWCGRSWEGLVDRRHDAFAQAKALSSATTNDAPRRLGDFLLFFETTGIGLFRDEEEWIFGALRPAPRAVVEALEEHIRIGSYVKVLLHQATMGRVDLGRVRRLGELLGAHLLMEEERVRPLVTRPGARPARPKEAS